jgi:hypothetical protein
MVNWRYLWGQVKFPNGDRSRVSQQFLTAEVCRDVMGRGLSEYAQKGSSAA